MSVLFPKVNKPREWDYRPIYYDEEKEARKQKLARLRALREEREGTADAANGERKDGEVTEHVTTLHRGSFREAHEAGMSSYRAREERKTKLRIWVVILVLLLFGIYLLGLM